MITPIVRPLTRRLDLRNAAGAVLLVAPSVTGTLAVGSTLTCAPGTWSGSPTIAYQWLRNGAPIVGATASTRVLTADDSNTLVQCAVTATLSGVAKTALTTPMLIGAYADFRVAAPPGLTTVRADTAGAFDADSANLLADFELFAPNVPARTTRGLRAASALTLPSEHQNVQLPPRGVTVATTLNNNCDVTITETTRPELPGVVLRRIQAKSRAGGCTTTGSVYSVSHITATSPTGLTGAANGDTWTLLHYRHVRAATGLTVFTNQIVSIQALNSSNVFEQTLNAAGPVATVGEPRLFATSGTITDADATRVAGTISISGTAGSALDVDIEIGLCQLYKGTAVFAPLVGGTTRAKDGNTLVGIPDGADGDVFTIAYDGGSTRTLTRAELFAATGSRTTLPLGAGDMPSASASIGAGGLPEGMIQTVTVTPA